MNEVIIFTVAICWLIGSGVFCYYWAFKGGYEFIYEGGNF